MRRRKQKEERWVGSQWEVIVNDGNGDNWFEFHPDAPLGPIASRHGKMDRATALDISRALREAADFLDGWKLPPRGGGKVVQLRKSKSSNVNGDNFS
jgi:hypothetical protein